MPTFFQFTQGTESHVRPNDTTPLLGRFRAVPPRQDAAGAGARRSTNGHGIVPGLSLLSRSSSSAAALLGGDGRGSVHVGYGGAALAASLIHGGGGDEEGSEELELEDELTAWERAWQRWVLDIWVEPRQAAVRRVVDKWWSRYGFLVLAPALLVGGVYGDGFAWVG